MPVWKKFARVAVVVSVFCCILLGFAAFATPWHPSTSQETSTTSGATNDKNAAPGKARLHMLVPATSSNPDLCKLIISAQILDYPTPVLINFGEPEDVDDYVQHLAKVRGILDYLDTIPAANSEFAEDLVLIVDGYDLWFQLHRDVLIERYYAINEAADARFTALYGEELFKQHDMRQTIVFGPDKLCWPIDWNRPACWAVPETPVSIDAFGPREGQVHDEQSEPRWLNSGTIIGPSKDIRELFLRTFRDIQTNHTTDSDQFYLAEIFGRQEYARISQKPEVLNHYLGLRFDDTRDWEASKDTRKRPDNATGTGRRTEFHIGIDYESRIFQTLAFWKQYLTWMRPSDSWLGNADNNNMHADQYRMPFPGDLASSPPPYKNLQRLTGSVQASDTQNFWHQLSLLYNTVTKRIPATIHFTGEKRFREAWWPNLWFHSRMQELRNASLTAAAKRNEDDVAVVRGYKWYNAEPPEAEEIRMHGLGGAWADLAGGWYSYRGLCEKFEGF